MRKIIALICLASLILTACNAAPTPTPAPTPIWIEGERLPTETPPAPELPAVTPTSIVTCSDASLQAKINSAVGQLIEVGSEKLFAVKAEYAEGKDCVAIIFSNDFPPQHAWFEQGFEEAVRNSWPNWNTAPIYYILKDGNGYRISTKYSQNETVYAIVIGEYDINQVYAFYANFRH